MKKTLLVLLQVALFATFVSCSKDEKKDFIFKVYSGNQLIAYTGEEEIESNMRKYGSVNVKSLGNNKATLELTQIVSGISKFEMPVDLQNVNGITQIYGEKTVDGIKVVANGKIENGIFKVKVTNEILTESLLKNWTYGKSVDPDFGDLSADFFDLNFENKSDSVFMVSAGNKKVPCDQFEGTVKAWVQMIAVMGLENPELIFHKNGFVSFKGVTSFVKDSEGKDMVIDLNNVARYNYNSTTKTLTFEVPIDTQNTILYLNFSCDITDGLSKFTIDPAILKMLISFLPVGDDLTALLSRLDALVPPSMADLLTVIKNLVTDIVNAVTADDVTSIGIDLKLEPTVIVQL